MTPKQKLAAQRLTSLFENGTIKIQYAYAENLGDGRGITCGRAGFCTGTGDAYQVVKGYAKIQPANSLAQYLPELKRLNTAKKRDDTSGLKGFIAAWKREAKTQAFCKVQDGVMDDLYWNPSQTYANELGLKTALARAFIFDTIIQHGDDDDPDSLTSVLLRANAAIGGTPRTGIPENEWLTAFISARRADLAYCSEKSSRRVWAQSVGRCDTFSSIAATGNYALATPFTAVLDGRKFLIP